MVKGEFIPEEWLAADAQQLAANALYREVCDRMDAFALENPGVAVRLTVFFGPEPVSYTVKYDPSTEQGEST